MPDTSTNQGRGDIGAILSTGAAFFMIVLDRSILNVALPRGGGRTSLTAGSGAQTFSANTSTKDTGSLLSLALGEMLESMDQPISSESLSRELEISTRQLQRIFKVKLNTNPQAYFVARRLEYARDLIQQAKMTVTEAAVAAGFVSCRTSPSATGSDLAFTHMLIDSRKTALSGYPWSSPTILWMRSRFSGKSLEATSWQSNSGGSST